MMTYSKILMVGSLFLVGCSSGNVSTSVEQSVTQPVYDCKTINYYNYNTSVPASERVEDAYFTDTFFGGDSRMGSLYLYSDLRDLGANVQYCESLSLYRIYDMAMTDADRPLYDLLMETDKTNIYILLGVNEIRYENFEEWGTEYTAVIQDIRNHNPQSNIYIMSSYHPRSVSGLTDDELNHQITLLNTKLQEIARENLCYYLETNEGILDENGLLKEELTWDGLHFNVEGSQELANIIATHVVRKSDYVKEMCE